MSFSPNGGNISGADDVALNNPAANHVLTYDANIAKWINAAFSGGVGIPSGYTAPTGADPTGVSNSAPALQAVLNGGGKLYVPAGTYRCTGPLLLDSNCHIYLSPGARILRDYVEPSNPGGTSNSFIRTRNLTGGTGYYNAIQPSHDVWIYGPGEISTADSTSAGNLFALAGDRIIMKDFSTKLWNGGRHTVMVGDDCRIINTRFTGGQLNGSGNGGIRFMGGKRFQGIGIQCESGDDTFQFVPAGAFADPFFDISIEDSVYIGCSGSSSSARLMVLVEQDQNNDGTTGMTGSIRRSGFIGCTGKTGGASFVIQNASSTGVVEDCFATNCTLDGSTNAGTGQPGAVYINAYATTGGIKRLTVDGLVVRNHHRKGIHFDRGGEDITFTNCHFTRGSADLSGAVAELSGINTRVSGCTFNGLPTGTGSIISVETNNGPSPNRVTIENCHITNIPNTRFGIDVVTATNANIRNNYFEELAGATTAQAFRFQAGSTSGRAPDNDWDALSSATKYTDLGTDTVIGTGGGGGSSNPYAAFVVRESGGVLPARSTVGATSTQTIFVISNIDPYANGYIVGVDVWMDPV